MELLKQGTRAPNFSLLSSPDKKVSLSDFRGKNVVLVFYPADWSPVCGDELALFNEVYPHIQKKDTELLGISVDNTWCHRAFEQARKFRFKLLSDFEPKGAVSKAYGAYQGDAGVSGRALFVIDRDGIIRWSYLSPNEVNPGAGGVLDALEKLSHKGAA